MNRKMLTGLAAALVAAAAFLAAAPESALACAGGLGNNCTAAGTAGFAPIRQPGFGGMPGGAGPDMPGAPGTIAPAQFGPVQVAPGTVRMAAGNCGAAAAQAAAAQGGQVIGAPKAIQRGNQTMCVVTVLIKDPTGRKPPVRKQITVPAN